MITEDYCSYEVAKLLKEKGFPTGVGSWSKGFVWDGDGYVGGLVKHEDSITHQMAMKWLREKGIDIAVTPYFSVEAEPRVDFFVGYTATIYITDKDAVYIDDIEIKYEDDYGSKPFSTYEEAVEAALKYALENLI